MLILLLLFYHYLLLLLLLSIYYGRFLSEIKPDWLIDNQLITTAIQYKNSCRKLALQLYWLYCTCADRTRLFWRGRPTRTKRTRRVVTWDQFLVQNWRIKFYETHCDSEMSNSYNCALQTKFYSYWYRWTCLRGLRTGYIIINIIN